MPGIKEAINRAAAVAVGGLLYAVLNWVPLLGASAAGLITGYWVGGGFGKGFKHAVYAASLGAITVAYVLTNYGLLDSAGVSTPLMLFVAWVMIVWNMVGILVTGLAGGIGAVGKDVYAIIPRELKQLFKQTKDKSGVDYLICSVCGQGNESSAGTCTGCGNNLK